MVTGISSALLHFYNHSVLPYSRHLLPSLLDFRIQVSIMFINEGDSLSSSPSSSDSPLMSQRVKGRMPIWRKRVLWGLLAMIIILPLSGALYQIIATEMDKR